MTEFIRSRVSEACTYYVIYMPCVAMAVATTLSRRFRFILPRRQLPPLPALSSSSQRTIVNLGLPHGYYAGKSPPTFALSHIPRVLICFFSRYAHSTTSGQGDTSSS
jgi:hypothetical protein